MWAVSGPPVFPPPRRPRGPRGDAIQFSGAAAAFGGDGGGGEGVGVWDRRGSGFSPRSPADRPLPYLRVPTRPLPRVPPAFRPAYRPRPRPYPAQRAQPVEPILFPRLRIRLAEFPYATLFYRPETAHLGDLMRIRYG